MSPNNNKGYFVISLDFELHWGVFDALDLNSYHSNLLNARKVVEKLIELSDEYGIHLTFATVGLLFAGNKKEIDEFMPKRIPGYSNKNLNPFSLLNQIGEDEKSDVIHYAKSLVEKIKKNGNHEIGTHTFGHYNCLASGQNTEDFYADLVSAKEIAETMDLKLESIVFPKNQVNNSYLLQCKKNGITNYRGAEMHQLYNFDIRNKKSYRLPESIIRLLRLIDGYLNISGNHTYPINAIKPDELGLINLPSSRFYRAYSPRLSWFEVLKRRRIKKAMLHAAQNNELFHLWWHPHNFGDHMEENFKNLENIFKYYSKLNSKYKFKSISMTGLTNEILQKLKTK